MLTKGEMQYMWDSEGNKYIDLLGQNLCISVGHGHPKVTNAAIEQMKKLPHCTTMYYHEQSGSLAEELIAKMPPHPSGEDWVVHLVNDGSEAVDLAIQMARVYTNRPEMIALHKAYHGLHGYAAGVTAIGKSTQPSYSSMFSSITHLSPNSVEALEDHIRFATGGNVAGLIVEPLQGYGGIFPLKDGYLRAAFDAVRKAGECDGVGDGRGRGRERGRLYHLQHTRTHLSLFLPPPFSLPNNRVSVRRRCVHCR